MAKCSQCSGRTNARYACLFCRKQPLCLKCVCTCGIAKLFLEDPSKPARRKRDEREGGK